MRIVSSLVLAAALAIMSACASDSQFVPPTATVQSLAQATTTPTTPTATVESSSSQTFLLEITSPQNESVVTTPSITVRGKSTEDAVVSVNGQLADVGADGTFESFVSLESGPNTIEIVANDFNGGQNSKILTVIYVP